MVNRTNLVSKTLLSIVILIGSMYIPNLLCVYAENHTTMNNSNNTNLNIQESDNKSNSTTNEFSPERIAELFGGISNMTG